MKEPYHKYVFDTEHRQFIGDFEEMYQNESLEHYDSWHQDDMMHQGKQIALAILNLYSFNSVLDIGCGKGAFTNLLSRKNNTVTGIDISETAIKKAVASYRTPVFCCANPWDFVTQKYDLIILNEILSYISNWQQLLSFLAYHCEYIFISLYLPVNPIGYVKNFFDLFDAIESDYQIIEKIIWNDDSVLVLCRSKISSNSKN
jgi:SAM-dependent methyltransferase